RFTNVTNGVTPRRFVALSNPLLAELITESIGEGWLVDLDRLSGLRRFAEDAAFRDRWRAVKLANKTALANWIQGTLERTIDPRAMLDAQCKRIHEYKRQHLNLLHVAWLFERIRRGDTTGIVPRTVLFAGKAAPAYHMAKLIIRLAHALSDIV